MNRFEAKKLTVENSPEYKDILSLIEKEVYSGKGFSVEYYNSNFRDYTTLAYAIVDILSDDGYDVSYDKFTYTITVSWK